MKFSSGSVRRPFSKLFTKLYEIRRELGHEWLVDILVSSEYIRTYTYLLVSTSACENEFGHLQICAPDNNYPRMPNFDDFSALTNYSPAEQR